MDCDFRIRRTDKSFLFQILAAQQKSKTPEDFKSLLAWVKAMMEPTDIKLVLQEFEEWKNS